MNNAQTDTHGASGAGTHSSFEIWDEEPTLGRDRTESGPHAPLEDVSPVLLVESGPALGRYFALPADEGESFIGRGRNAHLRVRERSVSRQHARVTVSDGIVVIEDLESLNGSWVNGRALHGSVELRDGDRIRLGDLDLRLAWMSPRDREVQDRIARQVRLAERDALTGLHNRHYLLQTLPDTVRRHRARDLPLTIAAIDVDRFKAINDTWGHATGDAVLTALARLMAASVRPTDQVIRAGGEEFWVVLQETGGRRARRALQRLRDAVAGREWAEIPTEHQVTLSAGVAELRADETMQEWMERADQALYQAKNSGRNRVILLSDDGPELATGPSETVDPPPDDPTDTRLTPRPTQGNLDEN